MRGIFPLKLFARRAPRAEDVRHPTDEASIAYLTDIRDRLDETSDGLARHTEPLRPEDFALIGRFIQVYCVFDLMARRVLGTMQRGFSAPGEQAAPDLLHDKALLEHLDSAARSGDWPDDIEARVTAAVKLALMHRQIRHDLAHWAARRIRDEEVYLLLTKSNTQAKKRSGTTHQADSASSALIEIWRIHQELGKLEKQAAVLEQVAVTLETSSPYSPEPP